MKRRKALTGIILIVLIGGVILWSLNKQPLRLTGTTLSFQKGKVGVVEIKGLIYESEDIIKDIIQFREDNSIAAVVVRIDSPGGAVGPAQEIYAEIGKLRNEKVVVASLGTVGASGGYYIACGAGKIVANPGTITGSIGVVMEFVNLKELLKWTKIEPIVIKSGEFKDTGVPFRDMTEAEKRYLQSLVDNVHYQFIRAVSDGRKMPIQTVKELADGRVFSGEVAKELGLIDELGNFQDSIELAAKLANIEGKPQVIYPVRKKFKVFEKFIENLTGVITGGTGTGGWLSLSYLLYY